VRAVEGRCVDERHRPRLRQATGIDLHGLGGPGWNRAAATPTCGACTDERRAPTDQSRGDRNGRAAPAPSPRGLGPSVAAGRASEAMSPRPRAEAPSARRGGVAVRVVAGTDRGQLQREYPGDARMHLSHETIYGTPYVPSARRSEEGIARPSAAPSSAAAEPALFDRRAAARPDHRWGADRGPARRHRGPRRTGHWKADLRSGAKNSHIATLVERQSLFVKLIKVPSKDAETVVHALTSRVRRLPNGLMASLTWHRGLEMAHHKRFSVPTDVAVFVTRRVPGNAAPTRTPMACCGNTSRRTRICRPSRRCN
jgi:hypothetical protein